MNNIYPNPEPFIRNTAPLWERRDAWPILFSREMVRALLDGRKTQTRRIVKPQPTAVHGRAGHYSGSYQADGDNRKEIVCPYGQPGDRLWVKETFRTWLDEESLFTGRLSEITDEPRRRAVFASTEYRASSLDSESGGWRPSIFMPEWLSRITLELTRVRLERLQSISEADAIAEGIEVIDADAGIYRDYNEPLAQSTADDPRQGMCFCPVRSYETLWNSINGPGSWDANPFVWVLEFNRVQP